VVIYFPIDQLNASKGKLKKVWSVCTMWQILKTGRIKGNRSMPMMQWEVWRRKNQEEASRAAGGFGFRGRAGDDMRRGARRNSQTSKQGTQGGGTALPRK
jgi:hypothetical protein